MNEEPRVLVVDDHYASLAKEEQPFFDKQAFFDEYGRAPFSFDFCDCLDHTHGVYSLEILRKHLGKGPTPDAVLLDVRFGEMQLFGLDLLQFLSAEHPAIPVIMMTSSPREELLAECIDRGAIDYLVKPIRVEILEQLLHRYTGVSPDLWLIGQSEAMEAAVDQVARAAEGGASSVLLLGPAGAGKELFARYLHRHGVRRTGPFQPVHIPSIPEGLVDAELFGYAKGAFTGALRDEPGRLCQAGGGVLFLDEIGDLRPSSQASLLRVLETREVTRLGDGRTSSIDVQVVAATNANLAQLVKTNQFRLDLYTRLGGSVIQVPSLTERRSDLPLLLRHLQRRAGLQRKLSHPFFSLPLEAIAQAYEQSWPGNIRDLWNFVQRAFDAARGEPLRAQHYKAAVPDDLLERPSKIAHDNAPRLEGIPEAILRSPGDFLERLILRELSLLYSALDHTRDPLTGAPNRAKAAALLKGRARTSTNDFDRWLRRLLSRLSPERRQALLAIYPDLATTNLRLGDSSQNEED